MHPLQTLAVAQRRTALIAFAGMLFMTGLAGQVQAQTQTQTQGWPIKQIKRVVGFSPGVGIGIGAVARNLQPRLQEAPGQQVIIDHKPGVSGILAASELTRAAPDGYTIVVANFGLFVLAPNRVSKNPFDPQKDFTYRDQTSGSGFIAAVPANHPARALAEFVAWAKAHPDKANFASGGVGAITHLNGEMLNQAAGTKLAHVPYKSSAPVVHDLIGGQTKLRVGVATMLLQRIAQLPHVPTSKEAGFPVLGASGWQDIVGPAGMPTDVVARISKATHETLAKPDVRAKFAANRSAIMEKGAEQFTTFHTGAINHWLPAVKASGATLS